MTSTPQPRGDQELDGRAATPPWWPAFFDDDYAQYRLASTPPEQVERMAAFIVRALELAPGQMLFDQCCGIGRLSLPLAERGVRVIGVDLMPSYVKLAQAEAQRRGLPCRFFQGDAFEFVAPEPCDAALNWFTSFGYTADDERNILMLQRVFESLKPGGRALLDYQNMPRTLRDFRPSFIERGSPPAPAGLIIMFENRLDFAAGMSDSLWTFIYPDGRRVARQVQTRLYMPHELVRMFTRCGFEQIELLGSADGEPFALDSRRCIVRARRPDA